MLSVGLAALLTLAAAQDAAPPPASQPTDAFAVASRIDAVIQPRFQTNAGQFGEDRVESSVDGHPTFDMIDKETVHEQAELMPVLASQRPFVIALLHCAHKPGSHIDTHDRDTTDEDDSPYVRPLVSAGFSNLNASSNFDWANNNLSKAVLPYVKSVKHGESAIIANGHWLIVIRPIKAEHESCVSCHAGAKAGETLGAMVYAVRQTQDKGTPNHYFYGDSE